MAVFGTIAALLFFSAWDVTSKAAVWAGLVLLAIVWLSAFDSGAIAPFLTAAFPPKGTP